MKIQYVVHSAAAQSFETTATLGNGQVVSAAVPGLVIELVSTDGTMTHTLKIVPEDVSGMLAEFAVGTLIEGSFTKVES